MLTFGDRMMTFLDLSPNKTFIEALSNYEAGFKKEGVTEVIAREFAERIEPQINKIDVSIVPLFENDNKRMSMWSIHMDSCRKHLDLLKEADRYSVGLGLSGHSMAVLQTTVEHSKVFLLNAGIDWE